LGERFKGPDGKVVVLAGDERAKESKIDRAGLIGWKALLILRFDEYWKLERGWPTRHGLHEPTPLQADRKLLIMGAKFGGQETQNH